MKVSELIEALQKSNPDSLVNRFEYDVNGDGTTDWVYIRECIEETSGVWDHDNNCAIYEVFIQ